MCHGQQLFPCEKRKKERKKGCPCPSHDNIVGSVLRSVLTLSLDGDAWQTPLPSHSIPKKEPQYQMNRKLGGTQDRSRYMGGGDLLHLPECEPRNIQLVAQSQCRLCYACSVTYLYNHERDESTDKPRFNLPQTTLFNVSKQTFGERVSD
jgi:hypothetical protein